MCNEQSKDHEKMAEEKLSACPVEYLKKTKEKCPDVNHFFLNCVLHWGMGTLYSFLCHYSLEKLIIVNWLIV